MIAADRPAVDRSLGYLLGRLALVEVSIRAALAHRLSRDPEPDDHLRGVYLSDAYVGWLLDRTQPDGEDSRRPPWLADQAHQLERDADAAEAAGATLRLRSLSAAFGLDPIDEQLLVIALAPDLDHRFHQLVGYLNDDVTRRHVTVALALELATDTLPSQPQQWLRLEAASRLVSARLLEVVDADRPLPARQVRVPDRVVRFLLGSDTVDESLSALLRDAPPLPLVDPALAELNSRDRVFIRQSPGTDAASEAAAWLAAAGQNPLVAVLPEHNGLDVSAAVALLSREARLTGRPLVIGPLDAVLGDEAALAGLAATIDAGPGLVLWATGDLDLRCTPRVPVVVDLSVPPREHRLQAWRLLCPDSAADEGDLATLADRHRLGTALIAQAVAVAQTWSASSGRDLDTATLTQGVRALDGTAMQRLSRRINPRRTWDDLVLPTTTERELRELVGMVRMRDRLADDWGLARGGSGRGVAALFVGPSGTGKTLAAEVVAAELGVDLYAVDLSRVVDKYVGETEKNLDRVLDAAETVTGVLFFDEADALFGKRGDVRDGQDRYANLEVSYLLQRVEAFGGVAILSTNLRAHVDDAFVRRLDALVEFPAPDADLRARLWHTHTAGVPCGDDLDLDFAARRFELSGGSIRNSVVTAACLAAESDVPMEMEHIIRGLEREYQKLGRLRVAQDFGPYTSLLAGRS